MGIVAETITALSPSPSDSLTLTYLALRSCDILKAVGRGGTCRWEVPFRGEKT